MCVTHAAGHRVSDGHSATPNGEDEICHSTWGLVGPLSSGQADQLAPISSIGNVGVMLVCQFHNNFSHWIGYLKTLYFIIIM